MMPLIVRLCVASDTLGGGAYAVDSGVFVEVACPASCIVSVFGFLGGGVYARVFGLLVGAVSHVKGVGPAGGGMEGGVRKVSSCCPCVRGGCGCPFSRSGVPLLVLAVGDSGRSGPSVRIPGWCWGGDG